MGKNTNQFDWNSEADRQKWLKENPIKDMVIPMNNAEPEDIENIEKLQQQSLGDGE